MCQQDTNKKVTLPREIRSIRQLELVSVLRYCFWFSLFCFSLIKDYDRFIVCTFIVDAEQEDIKEPTFNYIFLFIKFKLYFILLVV